MSDTDMGLIDAYRHGDRIAFRYGERWWSVHTSDLQPDSLGVWLRMGQGWTQCPTVYQYKPERGGFSLLWESEDGWRAASWTRELIVFTDRGETLDDAQTAAIARHETAATKDPRDLFDDLVRTAVDRSGPREGKAWAAASLAWHRAYLDAAPMEIP